MRRYTADASEQRYHVYVCALVHDAGPLRSTGLRHQRLWASSELGGRFDGFDERPDVSAGLVWHSEWLSTLRGRYVQPCGGDVDVHGMPCQHIRKRRWAIHMPVVPA
jgi:hypothetical protein